jgi:hypothetical protein
MSRGQRPTGGKHAAGLLTHQPPFSGDFRMRDDEDAREFDRLFERYVLRKNERTEAQNAVPKRFTRGTAVDRLTAWLISEEGRVRVRRMKKALKRESKALKDLEKFARLRVVTHPLHTQ